MGVFRPTMECCLMSKLYIRELQYIYCVFHLKLCFSCFKFDIVHIQYENVVLDISRYIQQTLHRGRGGCKMF